jgi:hypothetical protein
MVSMNNCRATDDTAAKEIDFPFGYSVEFVLTALTKSPQVVADANITTLSGLPVDIETRADSNSSALRSTVPELTIVIPIVASAEVSEAYPEVPKRSF